MRAQAASHQPRFPECPVRFSLSEVSGFRTSFWARQHRVSVRMMSLLSLLCVAPARFPVRAGFLLSTCWTSASCSAPPRGGGQIGGQVEGGRCLCWFCERTPPPRGWPWVVRPLRGTRGWLLWPCCCPGLVTQEHALMLLLLVSRATVSLASGHELALSSLLESVRDQGPLSTHPRAAACVQQGRERGRVSVCSWTRLFRKLGHCCPNSWLSAPKFPPPSLREPAWVCLEAEEPEEAGSGLRQWMECGEYMEGSK